MRGQVAGLERASRKQQTAGGDTFIVDTKSDFTPVRGEMFIEGRANTVPGSVRRSGTYLSGKGLIDFRSSERSVRSLRFRSINISHLRSEESS